MRLAQMRLLSCVAITVAIGSVQLPSQSPVDFRVFSKCESNSTDDEDRVFLRSEKQAMPLTTVIDDYVHEIENGNLFRIANSILAAEKYSVDAADKSTRARYYLDICVLEVALAKQKLRVGDPKKAQIYLNDSIRNFQVASSEPSLVRHDRIILRRQFIRMTRQIEQTN